VTAQQLVNALASGCRDIRVSDRARIDLSQLAAHPDHPRATGHARTMT
jgi:hypothetical protein